MHASQEEKNGSTLQKGTILQFSSTPMWQFWDSGGVKLEFVCNFGIVGCQWTVNCLLGSVLVLTISSRYGVIVYLFAADSP